MDKDVSYTVRFDASTTVAFNGLQNGFVIAFNERGAEICQEDTLTLKIDGTYELIKRLASQGADDDKYKINILYSYRGKYTIDGEMVLLEAPLSGSSNTDWGGAASYVTASGGIKTNEEDANIFYYFSTAFMSDESDNVSQYVILDNEAMTFSFGEAKNTEKDYCSYTETELSCSNNGKNIYGIVTIPDGIEGKIPMVILSHGYNGTYEGQLRVAKYLAAKGIASYRFDFCGGSVNSKSDGVMTDMSIVTEKDDLLAVIDFVKQVEYVDADNFFLYGESQGGCVSAITAAEVPDDIKGLVLIYPAFIISVDAEIKYPNLEDVPDTVTTLGVTVGKRYYTDLKKVDIYKDIAKYTKDVLIIHGDADGLVDISYSQEAVKVYQSSELIIMAGEGHGFTRAALHKSFEKTYEFISNHLS